MTAGQDFILTIDRFRVPVAPSVGPQRV